MQPLINIGPEDLTREDFGYRLAQLSQGFESRFGRPLAITGTDTLEHVRLHGRGMAADIRTHGLGPEHLDWLRDQTRQLGLTARDYSGLTGPVTTSTGVRLTGPHFHVHYGGGADYGVVPPGGQDTQSSAGQGLIKASAKDLQQEGGSTTPIPVTADGIATDTAPSAQQPSAPTRKPVVRRGNIASITITPEGHGRVIDSGVVQPQSHPTSFQATHRGDSIQIDASDLLDRLNRSQITAQQFHRAFQDRYAAGLGFGPAEQEAMRQYYRSQGSDYDPFSFAASPDELIAQARRGTGFVTVGRSPDVIRNMEAFRHSAYLDPITAQIRNAASPQADLNRAIQGLIDKGIDPTKIGWQGDLDPDSQLRILADAHEAWPELQRYFDARSRLHPGVYQQPAMDVGSAAAGAGSRLVQTAKNLETLLFSRGEPTEPPEAIDALRQELIKSGVPADIIRRDDPDDFNLLIAGRPDLRELIGRYLHARFGALRFHESDLARQLAAQAQDEAKAAPGSLNEVVRDMAGAALELPKYALMGIAGPATPLVFAGEGALSEAHKGAAAAAKGAVGGLVYSAAPGLGAEMPTAVRVPFMASAGGVPAFIESAQPGVTPDQALLSAVPGTALMGGLGLRSEHTLPNQDFWLPRNDGSFWDTTAAEKRLGGSNQINGSYRRPELTSSEPSSYPTYEEVAAKLLNPPAKSRGLFDLIARYSAPKTLLEKIRDISLGGPPVSGQRRTVRPGRRPVSEPRTSEASSVSSEAEPIAEQVTGERGADGLAATAESRTISAPSVDETLKQAQGPDGSLELSLSGMRRQIVPEHRMADEGHAATDTAQGMLDRAYDAAIASGKYTGIDAFIGGTGSGKSVTSEATPLSAERRAGRIIVESHAENAERLAAKIDRAVEQGLPVDVQVVIRDPVKSFESAVGRFQQAEAKEPGSGKVVPVNYGAATHEAVIENVPKLVEWYQDDPLVRWHFIDNRGMAVEAEEVSPGEGLKLLGSIDTTDLRAKFNQVLDNTKLTKRDLQRFGEQSLPSEFGSAATEDVRTASSFAEEARYGDRNVVFTKERLARAQDAVRRKLNPNRLSAGIDPTVLPHLLTIAGYHLEAGSIEFAEWSSRMVNDLGDWVIPHLPELYRRALENVYWRSKRPGLPADEAESLRNVVDALRDQTTETPGDRGSDRISEQSRWANISRIAETGGVEAGSGGGVGSGDVMPGDGPAARGGAGRLEDSTGIKAGWSAATTRVGSQSRKAGNRGAGSVAAKPPFPMADADVRGVRRFNPNVQGHVKAWRTERRLALRVHSLPDEVVVHWGGPIGSHGPDIVSVNLKTGEVTLWDSKFRGRRVRIRESSTFKGRSKARENAIEKAFRAVDRNNTLPAGIRTRAIQNLDKKIFKTRTAGFGKAKNSILGR